MKAAQRTGPNEPRPNFGEADFALADDTVGGTV